MAGVVPVPTIPTPTSGLPSLAQPSSDFQKILAMLGAPGSVLGAQAAGDTQGQVVQGQLDNQNNQNQIGLYNDAQNAQFQAGNQDLQRQQFATNNRGQTAKQALVGALLGGGYKPTSINVQGITPANVSGGLARSLLTDPKSLAAMQTLNSQASTAQNTPLSFTGGNVLTRPTLAPPD